MNNKAKGNGYIALLLPELRIGGAQKVFLTLAKEFIVRGLRVDLILLSEEGELLAEIPEGVRLISLGQNFSKSSIYLVRSLLSLSSYLRKNRPDALLSTLTGTNLLAVVAHGLSHVSTRLVLREAAPLANIRHSYLLFLMRYLYRRADSVIVLTDFMKKEMERKLNLPSENLVRIGNPLDVEKIERESRIPLPGDFNQSCPYILSVGRLAPPKDFVTLINAFEKIARGSQIRLVILGEGPDRSLLETLIKQLSLEDRVELRGYDPNPYRWMAEASVFVLSSRWEGYPNVVIEARALGVPIIISEYDDRAREVSGRGSLIFPIGDSYALAEAIFMTLKTFYQKDIQIKDTENSISIYSQVLLN